MPIKRITISVPEAVAKQIKKAAGDKPVSAWVTDLIEDHLDDAEMERRWQEFYRDVNPSGSERRRAETMFERMTKPKRRRGVA